MFQMKFRLKTFKICSLMYVSVLKQHFNNYFVQELVIRPKGQWGGGAKMVQGGRKKFQGCSCFSFPLAPTFRAYGHNLVYLFILTF